MSRCGLKCMAYPAGRGEGQHLQSRMSQRAHTSTRKGPLRSIDGSLGEETSLLRWMGSMMKDRPKEWVCPFVVDYSGILRKRISGFLSFA